MRRGLTLALVVALLLQTYLLYLYRSSSGESSLPPGSDKVMHVILFGGPALLFRLRGWRWGVLALAVYAPLSEIIQGYVGRDPDWRDAVADLTGVLLLGALFGSWLRRRMH